MRINIVEKAEDWDLSSYQEYIDLRPGTLPKLEEVRSHLPSADADRSFVESAEDSEKFIKHLRFEE